MNRWALNNPAQMVITLMLPILYLVISLPVIVYGTVVCCLWRNLILSDKKKECHLHESFIMQISSYFGYLLKSFFLFILTGCYWSHKTIVSVR